jgi:hypothetical protein
LAKLILQAFCFKDCVRPKAVRTNLYCEQFLQIVSQIQEADYKYKENSKLKFFFVTQIYWWFNRPLHKYNSSKTVLTYSHRIIAKRMTQLQLQKTKTKFSSLNDVNGQEEWPTKTLQQCQSPYGEYLRRLKVY